MWDRRSKGSALEELRDGAISPSSGSGPIAASILHSRAEIIGGDGSRVAFPAGGFRDDLIEADLKTAAQCGQVPKRISEFLLHGILVACVHFSFPVKFLRGSHDASDLAEETQLPQARQDTCLGDYSNAAFSWDLLLKPHRRPFDQPKTKFDVVYGPAEGRAMVVERVARSIRLLETVAERASDEMAWRLRFRSKC